MLAELAIATAAINAVKDCLQGTGDIMAAAQHIGSFFNSKSALQKRVNEKGKSDIESFMALEQIAQMEDELKQQMLFLGRPGLHESWLQFQADAKHQRDAEEKAIIRASIKRKEMIWGWVNAIIIIVSVVTGTFVIGFLIWAIVTRGS